MTDHMDLRIAVGTALASGRRVIQVQTQALNLMIDELDVLRASVKQKPMKRDEYPQEFNDAYFAMDRSGGKWRQGSTLPSAFKAWKTRIATGATPVEIQVGVEKYARHCLATGREVMMAQTFFGPQECFTADWTIPAAQVGQKLGKAGQSTARAAQDWMDDA